MTIFAATLLNVAPALAAPAWLPPTNLSALGHEADEAQIAVNDAGEAVAVWERFDGPDIIETASHSVGGGWSAARPLSAPSGNASEPQIALNPAGEAVAIWKRDNGSGIVVESASRPPGGDWSPPARLSASSQTASLPKIDLTAAGEAVALWRSLGSSQFVIEGAFRPRGGDWSPPEVVSKTGQEPLAPQLAVNPAGEAIVVWRAIDATRTLISIESASRPPGGNWLQPGAISGLALSTVGQSVSEPQIALNPAGEAVAIWKHGGPASGELVIESNHRPPGGAWALSIDRISGVGFNPIAPQIALDPAGEAVAVWMRSDGTNFIIESSSRPAGSPWEQPLKISEAGQNAEDPQIAVDRAGEAVAVWDRSDGTNFIIESSTRRAGAAWPNAATKLSAAGQSAFLPQVALDGVGGAVAIWQSRRGAGSIVEAAPFDAAAPKLQSLSVPPAGRVGVALPFSFSALDNWSALGQSTWGFGDGSAAAGPAATHAYAKPGDYEVTLDVADALGNAAATKASLKIGPGARAARRVKVVRGRRALLALSCPPPASLPCAGIAKLTQVHGKKARVLGRRSFHLSGKSHRTVAIRLHRHVAALIAAAGRRGLKAQLGGRGISTRMVRLVVVGPRRR